MCADSVLECQLDVSTKINKNKQSSIIVTICGQLYKGGAAICLVIYLISRSDQLWLDTVWIPAGILLLIMLTAMSVDVLGRNLMGPAIYRNDNPDVAILHQLGLEFVKN